MKIFTTRSNPLLSRQNCFASKVGAVRHYPADLKTLKRRKGTVNTIGKITNTMKVVASSKMPIFQKIAEESKPFFETFNRPFKEYLDTIDRSELRTTLLVIATDKGLCGATNNAMTRMLLKTNLSNQRIIVWGEKGCGAFENSPYSDNVVFSAHPSQKSTVTYQEIGQVTEKIFEEEFDLLRIVYNKMDGPANSEIDEIFIPSYEFLMQPKSHAEFLALYNCPPHSEILSNLNEYHLSTALNYAVTQNNAVEMVNRRNSMDNASKNADEMGKKLNLQYNRVRQALITTELAEITSGAAAVEDV